MFVVNLSKKCTNLAKLYCPQLNLLFLDPAVNTKLHLFQVVTLGGCHSTVLYLKLCSQFTSGSVDYIPRSYFLLLLQSQYLFTLHKSVAQSLPDM